VKRLILAVICLSVVAYAFSAELDKAEAQLIESAEVQIYPSADYLNGGPEVEYRFGTTKTPEEVRAWYKNQLPTWSLYEEFGGWILYDGKPGVGMAGVMTSNQVSVQKNELLQEWFGVDKAMSTEIVVMIPGQ